MKDHTFTLTVGAPNALSTEEVCRLVNRIFNNGLDAALETDLDDHDPDIERIEVMSFEDLKPMGAPEQWRKVARVVVRRAALLVVESAEARRCAAGVSGGSARSRSPGACKVQNRGRKP